MKDYADIIDLLNHLWEHFDSSADIDSDGAPNQALRFCAEIDSAIGLVAALKREHSEMTKLLEAR